MEKAKVSPGMRLALDLGPLMLFFGTYYLSEQNLYTATALFIPATLAALGVSYFLEKRISPMPVITAVVVVIFGGLTLALDSKLFIMMKPTIVNGIFATILFAGLMTGRPLLKALLGEVYKMEDDAWRVLTFRWGLFFVFLAILNEVIRLNFSEAFWVNFKVWGVLPITLLFVGSQMPFILKHHQEEPEEGSDGQA